MFCNRISLLAGFAGIAICSNVAQASPSFSTGLTPAEAKETLERRLELATSLTMAESKIKGTSTERRKTIDELFGRLRKQFQEPAVPNLPRNESSLSTVENEQVMIAQGPVSAPNWVSDAVPVGPLASLPRQSNQAKTSSGPTYHTVAPGDTLSGISRRYYATPKHWKMLTKVNGLNGTSLSVGQRLYIPKNPESPTQGQPKTVPITNIQQPKYVNRYTAPSEQPLDYTNYEWKVYHVKSGDTLSSLAKRFCGSRDMAAEMAKYNQLGQDGQLAAGTNILVPIPKRPEISKRYLLSTQGIFRE